MKKNFTRTASVLLCVAMLTSVLITGAYAQEPFSDIQLQQVFDYDGFKTAVTIKPVYKDNGYANVSFTWGEVETMENKPADVTGRSYKDIYFGFDVLVSEDKYTDYQVSFTVHYNLFGGPPQSKEFTKTVALKAPLDKNTLKALIDTGITKLSMRYTEDSYAALAAPLAAANEFYADVTKQDYEDFTAVYDSLFKGINGLVTKNEGIMDMFFKLFEMISGLIYKGFGVSLGGLL